MNSVVRVWTQRVLSARTPGTHASGPLCSDSATAHGILLRMKYLALLIIVVLVALIYWKSGQRSVPSAPQPLPQQNPYEGLRDMALHTSRQELGIPAPGEKGAVWGSLMDWGVNNGTATVIAFADGSASVYFSSGGGFIGGQGDEAVQAAAKKVVAIANRDRGAAHPTSSFPLPRKGQVIFYFRTDEGVLTAIASQEELQAHKHRLSDLGDATQHVITEYRKLQDSPQ